MPTKQEASELALYLKSLPRMADKGKDTRIQAAKDDFFCFIQTYFPHHIDHAKTEASIFRQFIHANLYDLSAAHNKLLFTAYRGGAKTTVISKLFTLWLIAKKDVRFAVLVSSTDKLIGLMFEFFKDEFESNGNFIADFKITRPGVWRDKELVICVDGHLCKLMGFGAGTKLRGIHFLSYRPGLIILDDVENDEQVESKDQRDKLENWFKKAVMKLPARKQSYRLIVVGTVLHNDGLLKRLESRGDFKSYNFPLVIQFPDNLDDAPHGTLSAASGIHLAGTDAAAMNLTGLILDDHEINGQEVMAEYIEDKDSFMSEYQNTPLSKEGLLFEGYELFDTMPRCDIYWMGLDPAMGKKKGDYFGVAVLGKKGDKFYATVKGYRMSPVKLIPRIIATYARLAKIAPTTMAVEIVQFQEFFKDVLKKEALSIGIPLSVKEMRNTAPKVLRIDSIAPLINDGTILIHQADHLLIEELETYPSSAHDDLLDSLEMAYRIFRSGGSMNYKTIREKLKKRDFGRFNKKYT
ncbi:MAG: phage terminase large subunit [Mariprofundus sp.]|nr:phage terminase large subunit [Mariprofundus sp.]